MAAPIGTEWTDVEEGFLVTFYQEKFPFSELARFLHKSRDAVAGKVRRLILAGRLRPRVGFGGRGRVTKAAALERRRSLVVPVDSAATGGATSAA